MRNNFSDQVLFLKKQKQSHQPDAEPTHSGVNKKKNEGKS